VGVPIGHRFGGFQDANVNHKEPVQGVRGVPPFEHVKNSRDRAASLLAYAQVVDVPGGLLRRLWLNGLLLEQGCGPNNIVLGGDSAGGNLALVTLQRIRGANQPMPACAVLLSPGVDFTLSSPSMILNEGADPMFDLAELAMMRGFYARPERFSDPSVASLFGDFSGFPPLLFQVGSREVLLKEFRDPRKDCHALTVSSSAPTRRAAHSRAAGSLESANCRP
jgi:hypothetical protein